MPRNRTETVAERRSKIAQSFLHILQMAWPKIPWVFNIGHALQLSRIIRPFAPAPARPLAEPN